MALEHPKFEDVFNLMMIFTQLRHVSFESVGDAPFFPSKTNHFQPQKMGSLRLSHFFNPFGGLV